MSHRVSVGADSTTHKIDSNRKLAPDNTTDVAIVKRCLTRSDQTSLTRGLRAWLGGLIHVVVANDTVRSVMFDVCVAA